MWARLAFIVEFFKDLFFDKKQEAHFSSRHFNTRKFTVFLMVLSLFSLCSFLLNRTYVLTKKLVEYKEHVVACETPTVVNGKEIIEHATAIDVKKKDAR